VNIIFYEGAVGGETGAINPAGDDPPFTFIGWVPEDQTEVIADEGFGELVFTSVDPANGSVTATVTEPEGGTTACFVDESPGTTYPIMARTLTVVYAYCE
jgi:hypothetical protein